MMKNCTRCHSAHVKCVIIGDSTSCARCTKMHFQCVFRASLHGSGVVLPPSSSSLPRPPPPTPAPILPKWSHTLAVGSTSSDRVRAASVAFLAKHIANGENASSRLRDVYFRKAWKQEKFLSIVHASDVNTVLLTDDEILKDVIVFDGTASHPSPPISPPPM